jgi:hypothetical protein
MNTWLQTDANGFVQQVSFSETAPDSTWLQDNDYPIFGNPGFKYHAATKEWVADSAAEVSAAQAMAARRQRGQLLAQSDWTDTVSAQTRLGALFAEWQTYRQALRDIPTQTGFPANITWPNPPASS